MKTTSLLALATLFILPSCGSIDGETATAVHYEEGVPGGSLVETTTIRATVTGIEPTTRTLTLVTPGGTKFDRTVGPDVVNFDQVRLGDQLEATLTEEVEIRLARPDEAVMDASSAVVELTPIDARPGIRTRSTEQVVGTVTKVDAKRRKATLRFSDGVTQTFKVRPDIDLSKPWHGERVVIRLTESTVIAIEKP